MSEIWYVSVGDEIGVRIHTIPPGLPSLSVIYHRDQTLRSRNTDNLERLGADCFNIIFTDIFACGKR